MIPNFIMPLVFGFFTYKFGDHRLLSVLGIFIALGSVLIAIGCYSSNFFLL